MLPKQLLPIIIVGFDITIIIITSDISINIGEIL